LGGDAEARYREISVSRAPRHFRERLVEHGMLEWMRAITDADADRGRPSTARYKTSHGDAEDIVVLIANLIEGGQKWGV
jgi:hypothetical protein